LAAEEIAEQRVAAAERNRGIARATLSKFMKPFGGPRIVTISAGDCVRALLIPANLVLLRRRWSAATLSPIRY
jgi:hypothetical protein